MSDSMSLLHEQIALFYFVFKCCFLCRYLIWKLSYMPFSQRRHVVLWLVSKATCLVYCVLIIIALTENVPTFIHVCYTRSYIVFMSTIFSLFTRLLSVYATIYFVYTTIYSLCTRLDIVCIPYFLLSGYPKIHCPCSQPSTVCTPNCLLSVYPTI